MTDKIVKIAEVNETGIGATSKLPKELLETLRGKIVIIKPEDSVIAKNLGIKEKGVYGAKFR